MRDRNGASIFFDFVICLLDFLIQPENRTHRYIDELVRVEKMDENGKMKRRKNDK